MARGGQRITDAWRNGKLYRDRYPDVVSRAELQHKGTKHPTCAERTENPRKKRVRKTKDTDHGGRLTYRRHTPPHTGANKLHGTNNQIAARRRQIRPPRELQIKPQEKSGEAERAKK